MIHVVVEKNDVRVIVDSPDVLLSAGVVLWAVAIHLPVRNSIDSVGVRLFVGLLQAPPDKRLEIVFDGVNF